MADAVALGPREGLGQFVEMEGERRLGAVEQFARDALLGVRAAGADHVGLVAPHGRDGIAVRAEHAEVAADDVGRHQGAHGLVRQYGGIVQPRFGPQALDAVPQRVDAGVAGGENAAELADAPVLGRAFHEIGPFRVADHVDAVHFGMALEGEHRVEDDRLAFHVHELLGPLAVHAVTLSARQQQRDVERLIHFLSPLQTVRKKFRACGACSSARPRAR